MELIGHVYSKEPEYRSRTIDVCLLSDKSVFTGMLVAVEVDEGTRVTFQAFDPLLFLPYYEQYVHELKAGRVPDVSDRIIGLAKAVQIGYKKDGEVMQWIYPIKPTTEVHSLSDEEAYEFLKPSSDMVISIGSIFPSLKYPLFLDVPTLLRQGCLVTGAVGTGKTTTLMKIVYEISKVAPIPFCIIDVGGEMKPLAELSGFVMTDLEGTVAYRAPLSLQEFYRKAMELSGEPSVKKEVRALYAVLKRMSEEGKREFAWDEDEWRGILDRLSSDAKEFWITRLPTLGLGAKKGGLNVVERLSRGESVWIDCSGYDWDTIVLNSSDIINAIFERAKADEKFGSVIVVDEIHTLAPQRPDEGVADASSYRRALKIIKKVVTMGGRNLSPVFASTQRLAEVHKTVSTQLGMNMIAHQVEDVDLQRLEEIVGRVAYAASQLPKKGYAIVKSRALGIPTITPIVKVEKVVEPLSARKDVRKLAFQRDGGEGVAG